MWINKKNIAIVKQPLVLVRLSEVGYIPFLKDHMAVKGLCGRFSSIQGWHELVVMNAQVFTFSRR
jgi:hypothetical protein